MISSTPPIARARTLVVAASLVVAGFLALALAAPLAAQTADTQALGAFRAWSAWRSQSQDGLVCYIASPPVESKGDYTRRGEVLALVSHRPALGRIGEVSFVAGYPFRENGEARIAVGAETFTLFTEGEAAWAFDAEADARIVAAMRGGTTLEARGTSARGTDTTDTYSLLGFTAALRAAGEACGIDAP